MRRLSTHASLSLVSLVSLASLAAMAALPFAACSSDDTTPQYGAGGHPGAGGASSSSSGMGGSGGSGGGMAKGIEARFVLPQSGAPDFLEVPFPTDLYLDATGHVADVPGLSTYVKSNAPFVVAGLKPLDGFGTIGGAIFAIDDLSVAGATPAPAAIDASTLPATEADSIGPTSTAMIVDLDAADAKTALVPSRSDYHDDTKTGAKTRPLLTVWPGRGVMLAEKHHYAVVLTTGLMTKDKQPVAPSATFLAIRDGSTRSTAAEKLYGDAVDKAASLVPAIAGKKNIAAVAVYTTHGMSNELADLRGQLMKLGAPKLDWTPASIAPMGAGLFANTPLPAGFTATLDKWLGAPAKLPDTTDDPANDQMTGKAHDAIAAIGTAVFQAPNVLLEDPKGYAEPTHHTFARDASGKPIVNAAKPTSKIWMTIVLPKGAVPATGFPTVIIQHGLSSDRSFMLALSDSFAKKGWASVGIETVTFGARASEAANIVDAKSTFAWSANPAAYAGPDGFVDKTNGSSDFFGGLKSLGALRDQMRQSVLDIETAYDVVRDPALDLGPLALAVPGAKLDPTKVVYIGDSLGALMGTIVAATEPNLSTYLLNVDGGALLTELGPYSPEISASLKLAATVNFGFAGAHLAPGHPVLQLLEHVVDPGDPLLFAPHIVKSPMTVNGKVNGPKNVIQIEAVWDQVVPNESNEALAFAAGFPLAAPNVGSNAGLTFTQAMPVNGGISGVPVAGITAVLVQAGPATHGAVLYNAMGTHDYAMPYAQFDMVDPFPKLKVPAPVTEPYLALQAMMIGFFSDAFAGGAAPVVKGFPAPTKAFP